MTTPTVPAPIDRRLLDTAVTTRQLLHVWADHTPALSTDIPDACPACGHRWHRLAPLCPTAAIVRPLLRRRRYELGRNTAVQALTFNQYRDLTDPLRRISTAVLVRPIPEIPASADAAEFAPVELFDPHPYPRTGGAA